MSLIEGARQSNPLREELRSYDPSTLIPGIKLELTVSEGLINDESIVATREGTPGQKESVKLNIGTVLGEVFQFDIQASNSVVYTYLYDKNSGDVLNPVNGNNSEDLLSVKLTNYNGDDARNRTDSSDEQQGLLTGDRRIVEFARSEIVTAIEYAYGGNFRRKHPKYTVSLSPRERYSFALGLNIEMRKDRELSGILTLPYLGVNAVISNEGERTRSLVDMALPGYRFRIVRDRFHPQKGYYLVLTQ